MSLFNVPESKAALQEWIKQTNEPMAIIAAGMTEQLYRSRINYQLLVQMVSSTFLDSPLPLNIEDYDEHDIINMIEDNLQYQFQDLDPHTVLETIEAIASDIIHNFNKDVS